MVSFLQIAYSTVWPGQPDTARPGLLVTALTLLTTLPCSQQKFALKIGCTLSASWQASRDLSNYVYLGPASKGRIACISAASCVSSNQVQRPCNELAGPKCQIGPKYQIGPQVPDWPQVPEAACLPHAALSCCGAEDWRGLAPGHRHKTRSTPAALHVWLSHKRLGSNSPGMDRGDHSEECYAE